MALVLSFCLLLLLVFVLEVQRSTGPVLVGPLRFAALFSLS